MSPRRNRVGQDGGQDTNQIPNPALGERHEGEAQRETTRIEITPGEQREVILNRAKALRDVVYEKLEKLKGTQEEARAKELEEKLEKKLRELETKLREMFGVRGFFNKILGRTARHEESGLENVRELGGIKTEVEFLTIRAMQKENLSSALSEYADNETLLDDVRRELRSEAPGSARSALLDSALEARLENQERIGQEIEENANELIASSRNISELIDALNCVVEMRDDRSLEMKNILMLIPVLEGVEDGSIDLEPRAPIFEDAPTHTLREKIRELVTAKKAAQFDDTERVEAPPRVRRPEPGPEPRTEAAPEPPAAPEIPPAPEPPPEPRQEPERVELSQNELEVKIKDARNINDLIGILRSSGRQELEASSGEIHRIEGVISVLESIHQALERGEKISKNSLIIGSLPLSVLRKKVRAIVKNWARGERAEEPRAEAATRTEAPPEPPRAPEAPPVPEPPVEPEVEPEREMAEAQTSLEDLRKDLADIDSEIARKYGGITGWIARIARTEGYRDLLAERYEIYKEYAERRAVEVGVELQKALDEKIALVDAKAEAIAAIRKTEVLSKMYNAIFKTSRGRLARLGISGGLLVGSMALGGWPALGVIAARRLIGGLGTSAGSYEFMRALSESGVVKLTKEQKKSLKKSVKEEGLTFWKRMRNKGGARTRYEALKGEKIKERVEKMGDEEIEKAVSELESSLILAGKKPSENEIYRILRQEFTTRMTEKVSGFDLTPEEKVALEEAETDDARRAEIAGEMRLDNLNKFLDQKLKEADVSLDASIKTGVKKDMAKRAAALGLGALVATGVVAELMRGAFKAMGVGTHAVEHGTPAKEAVRQSGRAAKSAAIAAAESASEGGVARQAVAEAVRTQVESPSASRITNTMRELAEIKAGSGKGVTQVFVAQLENNPKVFGFSGDTENKREVARWAKRMAVKLAKEKGFIKTDGTDVGIRVPKGETARFVLVPDSDGRIDLKTEGKFTGYRRVLERAPRIAMEMDESESAPGTAPAPEVPKPIPTAPPASVPESPNFPPAATIEAPPSSVQPLAESLTETRGLPPSPDEVRKVLSGSYRDALEEFGNVSGSRNKAMVRDMLDNLLRRVYSINQDLIAGKINADEAARRVRGLTKTGQEAFFEKFIKLAK